MQVYVILCNKIWTPPPPPKELSKQTNKKKLLFLTNNELCKVKLNAYV